ncbi:MAG: MbnP family protein [Saprospiraceae bacterium]
MNRFLLSSLILVLFSGLLSAQTQVNFTINHKLGNNSFAMDAPAKNNMDHDFKYTRVQYYIAEITLTHDGGTETKIDDTYLLVDASKNASIDLGSHAITNLEKVSFSIGVDPRNNHADPASFPNGHPLAPVFPSMHWGWTAGYRFIAIEGEGGPSYNRNFQLHGLGDRNYFQTNIDFDLTADNGNLDIYVNADYTRALEDISVNNGVIVHGEDQEALKALENFRDHVFSAGEKTSSLYPVYNQTALQISPNPVQKGGQIRIALPAVEGSIAQVTFHDLNGKVVSELNTAFNAEPTFEMDNLTPGVYFVRAVTADQRTFIQKIVIQ